MAMGATAAGPAAVAATARGGLGEGDGSGDDAVQYWQLSWHFSMCSWVLQFVILSMSVLALLSQNSASLSTHAGGEGDGGEPGGGGGDGEGGGPGEGDGSGDDTVQCPQLSRQATMKGSVWHLLILSSSVITSLSQNSASLSTHAGGEGNCSEPGDSSGDGEGASGGLGEGDGSGDDAVQYWQLSWHFSMRSRVLQFMILSMSVLALLSQNSASLSTHAGGEGEGGEPGGGGGDGKGASSGLGEGDGSEPGSGGGDGEGGGIGDDTVQCPQLS